MAEQVEFCYSQCDHYKCTKKVSYSTMRRLEKEGKEPVFKFMHDGCKNYKPTWATEEIAKC